ncbi:MAG TPA: hypothetical protein DCS67_08655 [Clostridiales bacterium UBA8960]|nr:hypothetical protein [Clostridiales bacterium UBA8960]
MIDFFKEALDRNHLSHSYLISGSEDIELAKSIAQRILCKQEHTGCGSCSSCLKLASDNHPDLMIIIPDGASIKNAQVEAFQEFIYIRPFESAHKIVIFNEAHLMTERAQNRILKVLEEPPEYAVFLLLTRQMPSMLETVLSRCQILFSEDKTGAERPVHYIEKAMELLSGIESRDAGRVLEYGAYFKQEKNQVSIFLALLSSILRDIMIFRETHNYQLISTENLTILNYKEQLGKCSASISRRKNIELIHMIDEIDQRIKNNMNFDLTVDKLLFKCIEREV